MIDDVRGDDLRELEDAAIERSMSPDSALLVDYLAGELPAAKAAEVRERLANDPEFREMARPLMDVWNAPVAPALTPEELRRSWLDVRRRAGLPAIPGSETSANVSVRDRCSGTITV